MHFCHVTTSLLNFCHIEVQIETSEDIQLRIKAHQKKYNLLETNKAGGRKKMHSRHYDCGIDVIGNDPEKERRRGFAWANTTAVKMENINTFKGHCQANWSLQANRYV